MISLKLLTFLTLLNVITCANILVLNSIASPSHHMWFNVFTRGLAKNGHNITIVTVEEDKNPEPNIHYIVTEGVYEVLYGGNTSVDLLAIAEQSTIPSLFGGYDFCIVCCLGIVKSKGIEVILNYPNDFKFDVVVYDFTCGSCLLPFLHKFNYPPLISVSAFNHPPYSHHLIGGQKYPAYVPHYLINYSEMMTFPQRLFNNLLYVIDTISRQHVAIPEIEKLVRERYDFDFPPLKELEKKTALMFINTDSSFDFQQALQPNVVRIPGLQIQDPKELSKELTQFIESGKRGTILMSLGTNIKSNMLGNERLTAIVNTFAQLKDYNFLWKFESEPHELPVAPPKNVFISKFFPQNDILAHPSVKAFVTHTGLLSTQEALWYGKPLIAMPFFVDQIGNAGKVVLRGVGVKVDFRTLDLESLKAAILTVVENPSYSQKAKLISKIFRDKPRKALDEAIWWTEYVIRNPTGPQYESPSLKLGWFITNSYDVTLTVFIVIGFIFYILFKFVRIILNVFSSFGNKKLKKN